MDYNTYGFEDIFRALGYKPEDIFNNTDKTTFDGNAEDNSGAQTKYNPNDEEEERTSGTGGWNPFTGFAPNCNDMPGGFQKLYPELVVVMGEILGNIISRKLPANVQNSFGNWMQLIGQAILTYNAQQQYFQGGPGRYFSPIYYNVSNPFCPENSYGINYENIYYGKCDGQKEKRKRKVSQKDIAKLNDNINELVNEINLLKQEIDKINGKVKQE